MNFFKKIFSSKKKTETSNEESAFKGIYTDKYFNDRYTAENMNDNPVMLDGCLKMVESYFMDNKIERKVLQPVNHPVNLDQVVDDGMGFKMYCKAFQFEDTQAAMFLAFAFSDFLISRYHFKLYRDNQPEFPLRSMTLKYDKNGIFLSVYPFEYALKVLDGQSTFEDLYNKINAQIESLPQMDDVLKKFTGSV